MGIEIEELVKLIKESYDIVVYQTPNSAVSLTDEQRTFIIEALNGKR